MFYLGIDVGQRKHTAAIIDGQGKIVVKPFSFDNLKTGFQKLLRVIQENIPHSGSLKIALEASGHYWLALFEKLNHRGFDVTVFNPLQVSAFRNQGIRGAKTDRIDAVLIAQVLRYGVEPETSLPSDEILSLKTLTRYRADLSTQVTRAKNRASALLDQVFPEYKQLFKEVFSKSSMALLLQSPLPEHIALMDADFLAKLLKTRSQGKFGKSKAHQIIEAAKSSFGLKTASHAMAFQIKQVLEQIIYLKAQMQELDQEINRIVKPMNTKLTSIPGISNTIAASILAEIGDLLRFKHPKGAATALVAFAGLDPKVIQSGAMKGKAKMSKRGSNYFRHSVHMASFVASNCDPMFRDIYQIQKSRGKHHYVALSHVENKMIHVIYSVLKNNREYRPMISA